MCINFLMNNYLGIFFEKKFEKNISSIKNFEKNLILKSFLMTLYFSAFKPFISLINSKIILSHQITDIILLYFNLFISFLNLKIISSH